MTGRCMNPRFRLRMADDPPVSPAVPDPLPDEPAAPPPPPVAVAEPAGAAEEPWLPAPEEVDVPAKFEEHARALASHGTLVRGCLAGAVAALLCAGIFGGFACVAGCHFKFLCVGSGLIVGMAVRWFGRGSGLSFGVAGAIAALVGGIGACVVAGAAQLASRADVPLLDYVQQSAQWGWILRKAIGPAEVFWLLAAAVLGFYVARKPKAVLTPVTTTDNPFATDAPAA